MSRVAVALVLLLALGTGWARAANPEVNTNEVRRLLTLASLQLRDNSPSNALVLYRRVLGLDPGNKSAKYGISSVFIKLDRFKESIAILNSLLSQYPDDYVLINNAAWLLATAGDEKFRDTRRAVNLAREALLRQPNDYHVWSTLAEAHYQNRDYERALPAALEALRLAQGRQAGDESVKVYQEQVQRMNAAFLAFSLAE